MTHEKRTKKFAPESQFLVDTKVSFVGVNGTQEIIAFMKNKVTTYIWRDAHNIPTWELWN